MRPRNGWHPASQPGSRSAWHLGRQRFRSAWHLVSRSGWHLGWLVSVLLAAPLGAQPAITVGQATGEPGATVLVPVELTAAAGVAALQLDLVSDPAALAAGEPSPGPALGDHLLSWHEPLAGRLRLLLDSPTNASLADGDLVLLPWAIAPSAPPASVPITLEGVKAANAQAQLVPLGSLTPGAVEVTAPIPPRVLGVATVADTGDGQLLPGEATRRSLTQLLLAFSEAVADPAGNGDPDDVTNPANYRLVGDGGDGVFGSLACTAPPDPADVVIPIDEVLYDGVARVALLAVNGRRALPRGLYRLVACGSTSIVDLPGNPLDGDGNGTGGDDFVLAFALTATNLLANPNFDGDLGGWTVTAPPPLTVAFAAEDADGAATSGSARIAANEATGELGSLAQCLSVSGGTAFALRTRTRIESDVAGSPRLEGEAQFFASVDCTGTGLGGGVAVLAPGATGGLWIESALGRVTAPPAALSAQVTLRVVPGAATAFEVALDQPTFGPSLLFADGFESGDTSAWPVRVP
ncbi:MAG TPA: cohesin domain-containing protein [Thermoanaerobaculia bacterium]|nr:cohesin domain-containing protein [Thermoanaerobaculia bacterium]